MYTLLNKFRCRRGQATTEVVLLFPLFLIFIVFIIKIFGLVVLGQKLQIAGYYAARRFQLQSHESDYYQRTWDNRFLEKDIQKKVENYLGFDNTAQRKFLNLDKLDMQIKRSGTWTKLSMTAHTRPLRIPFLCKYNRDRVCQQDAMCYKGYAFLCETGGQMSVIKYVGHNERPVPYIRPMGHD